MNTPLQSIVEMFGLHFAIIKESIFNIYIIIHTYNMCFLREIVPIPNGVTNFDVFTLADGS